jgi:hypothetical protein
MQDRTIVRLKELSASHLVNNLINALVEINWDYIKNYFPDAHQRGISASDQQYAIDLIAKYEANANTYWYDYFVSCLPYSAPLYQLNNLRHIYVCALFIKNSQVKLEGILTNLEKCGLNDTDFNNYIFQAKDNIKILIERIALVKKILFYKINTSLCGEFHYGNICKTDSEDPERFSDELEDQYVDNKIQQFVYTDKEGVSTVISTPGLAVRGHGNKKLTDKVYEEILSNPDFKLKNIRELLSKDLVERIEKSKSLQISYKQKLIRKKAKLKAINISQQAVIKQLDLKLAQVSEQKDKLVVERDSTLLQLSFLANQQHMSATESHKTKVQSMQKAAQAAGLRFRK